MKKYNLTSSQYRVLFEFDDKGNIVFTNKNIIWGHLKINQEVDFNKLKESLNYCFKKNDNIRTKLCKEDDKIFQYFDNYQDMDFEIVDVNTENDVEKLQNNIINKPLEMFNSFLFHLIIYRYKNGFGGIIIKLSHVMGDGYTLGLILYEVLGYYSKTIKKIISFSYLNYINSEEKYPSSIKCWLDKKYWEKIFQSGIPDAAYVPAKKDSFSYLEANRISFDIDDNIIKKVENFCKINEISKSTFYMSIFGIYINKRTNLNNFFLSAANRNRKGIKKLLTAGMLTKIAYFIVKIQNEKFIDFAKKMRLSLKSSYKHMNYIYNYRKELLEKYNDNRTLLSNVFLSYQDLQIDTNKINIDFEIEGDNNAGTYGNGIYDYMIITISGTVYKTPYGTMTELTTSDNKIYDGVIPKTFDIGVYKNLTENDIKEIKEILQTQKLENISSGNFTTKLLYIGVKKDYKNKNLKLRFAMYNEPYIVSYAYIKLY